jgi:hypothetical protein
MKGEPMDCMTAFEVSCTTTPDSSLIQEYGDEVNVPGLFVRSLGQVFGQFFGQFFGQALVFAVVFPRSS